MSFGAYLQDRGWRGPGAPFGEPFAQGLGALACYVRDREWRGPGAPFGLGDSSDDVTTFTPDELAALAGQPAGPNALGYGANGSGSVSQFFQGIINQAGSGNPGLPTGAQAAAAFPSVPTWVWIAGGVGVALFLGGAFRGGRR